MEMTTTRGRSIDSLAMPSVSAQTTPATFQSLPEIGLHLLGKKTAILSRWTTAGTGTGAFGTYEDHVTSVS